MPQTPCPHLVFDDAHTLLHIHHLHPAPNALDGDTERRKAGIDGGHGGDGVCVNIMPLNLPEKGGRGRVRSGGDGVRLGSGLLGL